MRQAFAVIAALLAGCAPYAAAKPWADAVCDAVHALPEASAARLPADRKVVLTADSASVAAAVIDAAPSASASARTLRKIDVGY